MFYDCDWRISNFLQRQEEGEEVVLLEPGSQSQPVEAGTMAGLPCPAAGTMAVPAHAGTMHMHRPSNQWKLGLWKKNHNWCWRCHQQRRRRKHLYLFSCPPTSYCQRVRKYTLQALACQWCGAEGGEGEEWIWEAGLECNMILDYTECIAMDAFIRGFYFNRLVWVTRRVVICSLCWLTGSWTNQWSNKQG